MAAAEEDGDLGLFDQQIPVRLELAENENLSPDPVKPVYLMAPRQSYLPALALQVLPSFAHVLPPVLAPSASAEAPASTAAADAPPSPPDGGGASAAAAAPAAPARPAPAAASSSSSAPPAAGPASPWLDYEGLPLKGNLPVGVLFDLIAAPIPRAAAAAVDGGGGGTQNENEKEEEDDERRAAALAAAAPAEGRLPWRLTLHYRLAPPGGGRAAWAGAWENDVPPREHWLGALKEAAFCLAGGAEGARAVMRLTGEQQDALWGAAARGDALAYGRAAEPLGLVPKARRGASPCVPVRVLIRPAPGPDDPPEGCPPSRSVWERMYATSRPMPVLVPLAEGAAGGEAEAAPPLLLFGEEEDEAGAAARRAAAPRPTRAALLADALHSVAPALFPAELVERAVAESSSGRAGAAARARGPGEQEEGGGEAAAAAPTPPTPSPSPSPRPVVLVGGVCPPLSSPLAWLHARLCGPDAFLYVVVRCC